jgi:putative transposase
MPRKPSVFLPSVPCHVISRGDHRDVCVYTGQDYYFYPEYLYEVCIKYDVLLHAYVLLSNHVYLLLNPSNEIGIPKVMQSIGRRYVHAN